MKKGDLQLKSNVATRVLPLRSLAWLPVLLVMLGAGDVPPDEYRRRQREIEALTTPERERLKRNDEAFRELSQDEQQRFREMHAKINDKKNNSKLRETFEDYFRWLNTLNPQQRDDLRRETDPLKRIALVRNFVQQNEHETNRKILDQLASVTRNPMWRIPLPHLNEADLRAVMELIEADVRASNPELSTQWDEGDFSTLEEAERYVVILKEALKIRMVAFRDAATWPPRQLGQKLLNAVSDEHTKRGIMEGFPESRNDDDKVSQRFLLAIIRGMMLAEIRQTLPKLDFNSSEFQEFSKRWAESGPNAKSQLVSGERQKLRLQLAYLWKVDKPKTILMMEDPEFGRSLFRMLRPEGGFSRPRGPRPPDGDGPPPGRGPGADDDGERNRGRFRGREFGNGRDDGDRSGRDDDDRAFRGPRPPQ